MVPYFNVKTLGWENSLGMRYSEKIQGGIWFEESWEMEEYQGVAEEEALGVR